MKQFLTLLILIVLISRANAQYVYTIKADSVKLTDCDSTELIIENHTQGVPGFLFNTGNGRTIFKRAVMQLDDSTYVLGVDTIHTNRPSYWKANGTSIYNTNPGNVGIGRQSPKVLLDLPGPVNIDDTSSYRIHYHPVIRLTGWLDTARSQIISGPLSAYSNLLIGDSSGLNSGGYFSTFIGNQSGANSSGDGNTMVGYASGYNNGGLGNTLVGTFAGMFNSGDNNLLQGYNAGSNNSGSGNCLLGDSAGMQNFGNNNVALGLNAGMFNGNSNCVYIGANSGYSTRVGGNGGNTFVGANSGNGTNAFNVTLVGNNTSAIVFSRDNIGGGDVTAIGANAAVRNSNTMVFGDSAVRTWLFNTGAQWSQNAALIVGFDSTNGNGAYLTTGGAWTNASDRNKKENFQPLSENDILAKINQLPVTRWNYKGLSEQHIGPVAQDFHRIFNVGSDDKTISTIDPAGIALAGIRGLYHKWQYAESKAAVQADRIKEQQSEIDLLKSQLLQQENKMQRIMERLNSLETAINEKVTQNSNLAKTH